MSTSVTNVRPRILIVGGGFVGFYTALRLEQVLAAGEAEITLVNRENFMLYQPLLPEVASGTLEPRHAVIPLRVALRHTHIVTGELVACDHDASRATVQPYAGGPRTLGYDHLVVALGSQPRLLPIPGLADQAVGFNSVAEAVHLRNQVLARMEAAASAADEETRRRAATFVFVGGGYTGVEALAELADLAYDACQFYPPLRPSDLRWVLVEVTDRILPTVDERLAADAAAFLRSRGIELHLQTELKSAEDGVIELSNGESFGADTLVWSAGVKPHELAGQLGLPADEKGRLPVDASLRVTGAEGAWSAGDCAAVPDIADGGLCPPTAQYALQQARQLGDNLAAAVRGRSARPFRYTSKGEFVTLGMRKAVAEVYGRRLEGLPAWLLRRGYYASLIPTANRKMRVLADWTVGLPFGHHDVVNMGTLQHPRKPLQRSARRSATG